MYTLPTLNTDNEDINLAYRIAMGDIYSNIASFRDGLLTEPKPVLLAGAGYKSPGREMPPSTFGTAAD